MATFTTQTKVVIASNSCYNLFRPLAPVVIKGVTSYTFAAKGVVPQYLNHYVFTSANLALSTWQIAIPNSKLVIVGAHKPLTYTLTVNTLLAVFKAYPTLQPLFVQYAQASMVYAQAIATPNLQALVNTTMAILQPVNVNVNTP